MSGKTTASMKPEALLERYGRIFKGSRGCGFVDWDVSLGKIHWEGGFWFHLGYSEDVLEQVSDAKKLVKFIHPDDCDRCYSNIVDLLTNCDQRDIVGRVAKQDGSYVWTEIRLDAVRDEQGWASHLSGVVFDISVLKEIEQALKISEARHARIIEASNDGLWEWSADAGGKRMHHSMSGGWEWSEQADSITFSFRCWEMIGYSEDDDVVKKGLVAWRSLMHPDDGRCFDEALFSHIMKNTPFDIEYRIRGKDGEWRWLRGRGLMSYDGAGRPSVISGTNMDITELKRAEERVVSAKEEAEKANYAKSEFLSSMSHELRTPLNAILGFAQLFEMDEMLIPEQRENVQQIKSAGRHLLELIGDVLDLAKIEAGQVTISMEKVVPSRLINECVAMLLHQIKRSGLSLDIEFNNLENQVIFADPIHLKQVLLNLLSNACKYNKRAGTIALTCTQEAESYMKITVQDSGQGIPVHLQEKLFQPFNRLGAENSHIEGSGVGLVITKQLVEQMQGEIGFSSDEHIGSEFWVRFPLVSCTQSADFYERSKPPVLALKEEKMPALLLNKQKRILYVEDNFPNQKLLKKLLTKFPRLELMTMESAVEGLFLARSTMPDLVILDVNLPGLNGYELVGILKQDSTTRNIPVIALSANVLSHDIEKAMKAGFDRYLTKPLNVREFLTVCNELLGAS